MESATTESDKIVQWTQKLDQASKAFVKEFGRLTPEELNWKPNANQWSVGQCIDHIIVTNETYFPIIRSILTGNYQPTIVQRLPFLPNFFGKLLLKSIGTSSKKVKTFSVFEPKSSKISSNIVKDFLKHQDHLKTLIENTQHLDHERLVISSPVNKFIVYSLESAFNILVAHEFRHLAQAKEVANWEDIHNDEQ